MENDKSHNQPRQENHTYPSFHESNFIGWKPSVLDPLEIAVSDFPEITRVGLRRFDHYMYALASEAKAATLLYGVNDNPQTAPEIYHALEEILPAESWLAFC